MENVAALRRPGAWLWWSAALYAGLILSLSSITAGSMPDIKMVWSHDKLIHAAEYAGFAWLVCGALRVRLSQRAAFALAAVFCAGFGALDEVYQSTVPGRSSSVYDALADSIGAVMGAAFGSVWWAGRDRRSSEIESTP